MAKYTKLEAEIQIIAEKQWIWMQGLFIKLVNYKCPTIIISGRLTRTIGYNRSEENTITLGSKYIAKYYDRMVTQILTHELAHQIDYNLNGWNKGDKHHRNSWVIIMVKLGQEPNRLQYNMEL